MKDFNMWNVAGKGDQNVKLETIETYNSSWMDQTFCFN